MNSSAAELPELSGVESFTPELLRAFGEVARVRFGLARMERNTAALARRLARALLDLRIDRREARKFVEACAREPAGSRWLEAAADAVTNRETWFFRDHASLRGALLELAGARPPGARPLRALCAGCSTGEEPLSLAMLALDQPHLFWAGAIEVSGVDLSRGAIERARALRYRRTGVARAEQGPHQWPTRFFRQEGDELVARPWLSSCVGFELHNLLGEGPIRSGGFDLVSCRNVLIYFDRPSLDRAIDALVRSVRPGGVLLLGQAEAGLAVHPELSPTPVSAVFRRREAR